MKSAVTNEYLEQNSLSSVLNAVIFPVHKSELEKPTNQKKLSKLRLLNMDVSQETDKSVTITQTMESRFVIVANIYLSKSKQTLKILDLNGHLCGIFRRNDILDLFTGKINHVNVVLYRCEETKQPTVEKGR